MGSIARGRRYYADVRWKALEYLGAGDGIVMKFILNWV
jgi:hypothetical protein